MYGVIISSQNIIFPIGNHNIVMDILSVESINGEELKHNNLCDTEFSISTIKLYSNKKSSNL